MSFYRLTTAGRQKGAASAAGIQYSTSRSALVHARTIPNERKARKYKVA